MHVRCPYCQNPIEIVEEASLHDIVCESCGSSFSLVADPTTTYSSEPKSLAHFELTEQLGVGAFGTVWKARDAKLDRVVAVKIPRKDQLSEEDAEKFFREARTAAQVKHPNIVGVHEIGREDDSLYIVSDYVEGLTLSDWLTGQQPTVRHAVELVIKVADALQVAHDAGIVHRDLKPSNIILDKDNEPHVMDFGLAKREAGEITMTADGQVLGTPAYMSPEQARGDAHTADRRADIYALGVILFELLTGERPFRGNHRMLLHQVLHEQAPSPRTLDSNVPKDLETITLKCIEKDPGRRYQQAAELEAELKRYLQGEPIHSRPISIAVRSWRWGQRKPTQATLLGLLLFLAVFGPIFAARQMRLRREADASRSLAAIRAGENRRLLYSSDMNLALQAWEGANVARLSTLLKRHVPEADQDDLRHFEWYYLWRLWRKSSLAPTLQHNAALWSLGFSPRGQTLVSGSWDGTLQIWDLTTLQRTHLLVGHTDQVWASAFSPDGETIASGSGDNTIKIWEVTTGREKATLEGHTGRVWSLVFSSDGETLASASDDTTVRLWDVNAGTCRQVLEGHSNTVSSVVFVEDNKLLATGSWDKTVKLWDVTTGELLSTLTGHTDWVRSLAYSPDERILASGGEDGFVKVWNLSTRSERTSLRVSNRAVLTVDFSPDGRMFSTGDQHNTVTLWEVKEGEKRRSFKGHGAEVFSVQFSPDGRTLASSSFDGSIKLWDLTKRPERNILSGHEGRVRSLAFSRDGKTLASGSEDATVKLWDVVTGDELRSFVGHADHINSVAFATDGDAIYSGGSDMTIRTWDTSSAKMLATWETPVSNKPLAVPPILHSGVFSLAMCGTDSLFAAGPDGTIRIWNVPTESLLDSFDGHTGWVSCVAISHDLKTLASGSWDGTVRLWNVSNGKQIKVLEVGPVWSLAFSPTQDILAAGTEDQSVHIWKLKSGESDVLQDHSAGVFSVAFSPDGRTLASGSWDGSVTLRDGRTGEQRLSLKAPQGIRCLAVSPDGNTLAAGTNGNQVILWRASKAEDAAKAGW